jgi:hypothetical protein
MDPATPPVKTVVKQGFAASLRTFGLEPIDHFAHVFKRAWSVRLILMAGIFSGLEIALPILDQWIAIPRGMFAAASGLTTMAACIARLTVQTKMMTAKPVDGAGDANQ